MNGTPTMIDDRSRTTLEYGHFFLPGPTEVRPETLAAMDQPVIGHRSEQIQALIGETQPELKHLFGTKRPVYISTSSATGMMEAAITNLSRQRVLCLVCGAFSGRFHAIAEATGRQADRLAVEWGEPNLPDDLRRVLQAEPNRYDLVTVVHSETSTGTLNPLREIAAVVAEFDDILLAVDTVSSMAGAPLRMDDWALDYVLTGAQKALALPPGLALAAASDRALARAAQIEHRGFYFDLLKFEQSMDRLMTPNTPAVSLMFALRCQLEHIVHEGLETRWQRHQQMADHTHHWVARMAGETGRRFEIVAPPGYRSPTVTAMRLPEEMNGPEVVSRLRERGYAIAAGYGKLKQETIRIGHMGDHTLEQLEGLLEELGEVLIT
ncbi:MAG: alanine--glyoxylate aminotransferase family protein [Gemmatimonadales bacterium]|jgi:aspartate aminotransferase-like enzyme